MLLDRSGARLARSYGGPSAPGIVLPRVVIARGRLRLMLAGPPAPLALSADDEGQGRAPVARDPFDRRARANEDRGPHGQPGESGVRDVRGRGLAPGLAAVQADLPVVRG